MPATQVTVLWAVDTAPVTIRQSPGATCELLPVGIHELAAAVIPALARGAVVAVVADVDAAERALGAGADEVCVGESDDTAVASAVQRARIRAGARARREDLLAEFVEHEGAAPLVLLATGIAQEMNNPLAAATLNFDVVRAMFGAFASVAEELALHAERGKPVAPQELARLIAILASVPGSDEIDSVMQDIEESLSRMAEVIGRISALIAYEAEQEVTDLRAVIADTEAIVRPEVERVASLLVDLPQDACLVAMPKAWVVQMVAALILNSIHAVAQTASDAPEIRLQLVAADDIALIEVRDGGAGMSPEVRRHAVDPFYTTRRPGAVGLGLTMTAAYVRKAGGELSIESEQGSGTTIKIFVPRIKSACTAQPGTHGTELN